MEENTAQSTTVTLLPSSSQSPLAVFRGVYHAFHSVSSSCTFANSGCSTTTPLTAPFPPFFYRCGKEQQRRLHACYRRLVDVHVLENGEHGLRTDDLAADADLFDEHVAPSDDFGCDTHRQPAGIPGDKPDLPPPAFEVQHVEALPVPSLPVEPVGHAVLRCEGEDHFLGEDFVADDCFPCGFRGLGDGALAPDAGFVSGEEGADVAEGEGDAFARRWFVGRPRMNIELLGRGIFWMMRFSSSSGSWLLGLVGRCSGGSAVEVFSAGLGGSLSFSPGGVVATGLAGGFSVDVDGALSAGFTGSFVFSVSTGGDVSFGVSFSLFALTGAGTAVSFCFSGSLPSPASAAAVGVAFPPAILSSRSFFFVRSVITRCAPRLTLTMLLPFTISSVLSECSLMVLQRTLNVAADGIDGLREGEERRGFVSRVAVDGEAAVGADCALHGDEAGHFPAAVVHYAPLDFRFEGCEGGGGEVVRQEGGEEGGGVRWFAEGVCGPEELGGRGVFPLVFAGGVGFGGWISSVDAPVGRVSFFASTDDIVVGGLSSEGGVVVEGGGEVVVVDVGDSLLAALWLAFFLSVVTFSAAAELVESVLAQAASASVFLPMIDLRSSSFAACDFSASPLEIVDEDRLRLPIARARSIDLAAAAAAAPTTDIPDCDLRSCGRRIDTFARTLPVGAEGAEGVVVVEDPEPGDILVRLCSCTATPPSSLSSAEALAPGGHAAAAVNSRCAGGSPIGRSRLSSSSSSVRGGFRVSPAAVLVFVFFGRAADAQLLDEGLDDLRVERRVAYPARPRDLLAVGLVRCCPLLLLLVLVLALSLSLAVALAQLLEDVSALHTRDAEVGFHFLDGDVVAGAGAVEHAVVDDGHEEAVHGGVGDGREDADVAVGAGKVDFGDHAAAQGAEEMGDVEGRVVVLDEFEVGVADEGCDGGGRLCAVVRFPEGRVLVDELVGEVFVGLGAGVAAGAFLVGEGLELAVDLLLQLAEPLALLLRLAVASGDRRRRRRWGGDLVREDAVATLRLPAGVEVRGDPDDLVAGVVEGGDQRRQLCDGGCDGVRRHAHRVGGVRCQEGVLAVEDEQGPARAQLRRRATEHFQRREIHQKAGYLKRGISNGDANAMGNANEGSKKAVTVVAAGIKQQQQQQQQETFETRRGQDRDGVYYTGIAMWPGASNAARSE
ncbi:hypothetical protein Dda_8256 [Drechslerella dactyloides]|uniref:Uncharacterized protein n=1 Tax=Drechslerella dactyloides TaxID=74499 RepID=A0AAD6IVW6_DREDA|nr:hypothetical protein Dda_8256 [Drechslerella dactyloides]